MKRRVLVVAAHADDEVLGCGGLLARHADSGDDTAVMFLTDGTGSRRDAGDENAERRREAMLSALSILGVGHHKLCQFPDNALDSVPLLDVVRAVEDFCGDWGLPEVLYVHHGGDLNVDHQVARRAALTCFRPQPEMGGRPASILAFEVLSSTGWAGSDPAAGFIPNVFNDISETLARKLAALRAYSEEMRPWPHARSLEAAEALARFRGATVGLEAAEAFVLERSIG